MFLLNKHMTFTKKYRQKKRPIGNDTNRSLILIPNTKGCLSRYMFYSQNSADKASYRILQDTLYQM